MPVPTHIKPHIPVVFIANTGESFYRYVGRASSDASRKDLIREMQVIGDRGLLYLGSTKLVITSVPVYHLEYLREHLSYQDTQYIYPNNPSSCLSLDVMRDRSLLAQIVRYAGEGCTLQLIPHATTPEFLQLVKFLENEYDLTVYLPESPTEDCLWIRDYVDSKVGFKQIASQALAENSNLVLEGFTCSSLAEAARAAQWFTSQGRACVIKANRGNDALGLSVIKPNDYNTSLEIRKQLEANPFLAGDLIVVEEYAPSSQNLIPSAEFFVPSVGSGEPQFTYICNQIFLKGGTFSGVLLDPEFISEFWYERLKAAGLQIARKLQNFGYVGHFDLDAIVDDRDTLFLLEVNARRTGGTHIHELARHLFGDNYDRAFISNTAYPCNNQISEFSSLTKYIGDLLYPMCNADEGIIITHTSDLHEHRFGYIAIALTRERVLELQRSLAECVA